MQINKKTRTECFPVLKTVYIQTCVNFLKYFCATTKIVVYLTFEKTEDGRRKTEDLTNY
jgi:hypothetical protein